MACVLSKSGCLRPLHRGPSILLLLSQALVASTLLLLPLLLLGAFGIFQASPPLACRVGLPRRRDALDARAHTLDAGGLAAAPDLSLLA